MHRRNYTLHVTLAAALVLLAAAAGRIERWDWKSADAPGGGGGSRVVVGTGDAPAEPSAFIWVNAETEVRPL